MSLAARGMADELILEKSNGLNEERKSQLYF